ncbi:LysR family transcriptional regulator ArgP [Amycolatopsis regifaucium]|uniref:HTH-type transcriptional regulator LysG n=1 Tax=Amycolatopsis regifaucium TaxID=546365 RepID=A0A154MC85_9PSEU|nr:LysR family transcriptional regulator ArgP [Amycolatopsis regifaucium]KZB82172.1 chromosome replication initiation inhibitor protein [Amycolatopsis regifaucium]OKA05756.1 transcriptional regulator ArgP [Amycolatopsis regifaucium]SFG85074.1 transcriptional regulator, LysR family [Amycolatopsis regifaucium]
MMTDLPLDLVRTLLAVADEGTFDAAASALHVTPSAISQRVKALEQRTGRVLLIRTKPVRLTESGQAVVRFGRQLALLEADTRAELGLTAGDEPVRLPIAVNADSLATWFLPALTRVPPEQKICFELHREDQDHTTTLLREGLVMAAVTSSPDPVAGCSVHRLGHMRYLAVASPELGTDLSLAEAPVVVFDRRDDLQDRFARERGTLASPLRHYVPSSEGFFDAVAAGMGWGMVPVAQIGNRLRDGSFVCLDPDHPIDVPLFWQQWKLDSPALAAVSAAVTTAAADLLVDPPG